MQRYDRMGFRYACHRHPDPGIYEHIRRAIDRSSPVLNVGAGTGSYEPRGIDSPAVEPSREMIRQRRNGSDVVQACAEARPFPDASLDTVPAVLTTHHGKDVASGLSECARVARRAIAILIWDPASPGFRLTREYLPAILEIDREVFPSMKQLRRLLGNISVVTVPISRDCADRFIGAYWRSPEACLSDQIRSGMSTFARISICSAAIRRLWADLQSGVWKRRHGDLLNQESADLGYRLATATMD